MLTTELVETSNNNLVTKSNMLIEANYKLGVIEQKIILCIASNIQPTDSDFKTYTLPIKEFNKLLGLKGSPKYTELRKITRELMQKVFEVRIDRKVIQVAWLSYVAYNESEGTIDIRFDPFLRPYLLELKREFTSYKLENVVKLKSSYAIRIYELLKQYEKVRERVFYLDDLRKAMGAENVYPAYGNFKQRVLVPAQKELIKKTDISFELEEIKNGRRVEKVKFIISSKKKTKQPEQLTMFEDSLEDFQLADYRKANKLSLKIGFRLTEKQYKKWKAYGEENVLFVLEEMIGKKNINNPIGYITYMLKQTGSGVIEAAATTSDNQDVLLYLISCFKNSKERLPSWFVERDAISHLQKKYEVDLELATMMFADVKSELYDALEIKEEPEIATTNVDIEQKRKELLEKQKQYKERQLT